MMRVAMLSRWHVHANDYARQAANDPNLTIAAVWDENEVRGKQWASELGVPFFASLSDILSKPDIDAVIVTTPTNLHPEVIGKAIRNGKHVFTEKVLAIELSDCEQLLQLAVEQNIQLMVSLPRLTDNYYVTVQHLLDDGAIGTLTYIRSRLAHNGALPEKDRPMGWLPEYFFDHELCGGGALMDLGAHPIYLTNRLAGAAKSLYASFTYLTEHMVEDHATVVVDYASGITGTIEAGFISNGGPFVLELYGTEGVISVQDGDVKLRSRGLQPEGRLEWRTVPLLDRLLSPMQQWVSAVLHGSQPTITPADIRELTRINQAALQSNATGRKVSL
ncbi:MAG: dehydrogenase [Bacilli bacterium]|nr:dehydrogenase [Bacilli bacterium]